MQVKVLFFGQLKEVVGQAEERLDLAANPGETIDVSRVFDHYAARFPRLRDLAPSIVPARNAEFCTLATTLADGDELAFLPPVSGGSTPGPDTLSPGKPAPSASQGPSNPWRSRYHAVLEQDGHFFGLTRQPIDAAQLARYVERPEDGAVIQFEGIVRNNSKGRATRFLDYECYEPLALKTMLRIGLEIATAHPVGRVAMVHRLGRLQISDASVAVVVSAPHRIAAFQAALEGINRLKKLVPIWKKEYFEDGEIWVEGEWDDSVAKAGLESR